MAPNSVLNYISGLWSHHRTLNFETFQDDYRPGQTLRGIRRLGCSNRPPRRPLSLEEVKSMFSLINTLDPYDLVFWSALTLAYRALLRKSHYTLSPDVLHWRDVSLYPDHIIIVLNSSKTNQFSARPHRIVLNSSPGSCICPVFWLSELARVHNPLESDLVFRVPLPGHMAPLDYVWFNWRLKDLAASIGLSPVTVSSHSLRHGGASLMASLGSPITDIRARGGWSSASIFNYLHHSDATLRLQDSRIAPKI